MDETTAVLDPSQPPTPTPTPTPTDLQAMATVRALVHGRWKAQALGAALRLGVPAALAGEGRSAAELAIELGTEPDRTARLLTLLAAMGVVSRHGARYRLAAAAAPLLPEHPATAARDAAYSLSPGFGAAWAGLADVVRGGPPPTGPAGDAAAAAYRAGVVEKNLAGLLATHAVVQGARVAAPGPGGPEVLELLARRRPDLQPVAGTAPAEVYLLLHVLHDLDDRSARRLLAAIAAVAPAGAEVVVLAATLRDVGSHLLCAYLDVVQMLGTACGQERTEAEYQALFAAAGWAAANVTDVAGRPGIQLMVSRARAAG